MGSPTLIIIPSVPVWQDGDCVVFDRKFYDGMIQYVHEWTGSVGCIFFQGEGSTPTFDIVKGKIPDIPFSIQILPRDGVIGREHVKSATVIMAAADDYRQLHVSQICRQSGVKCVYVIENTFKTRCQMVRIAPVSFFKKLRTLIFLIRTERLRRRAFGFTDGIQANGTPAFEIYSKHKNCLLYFDTRMGGADQVPEDVLAERLSHFLRGGPIRLGFSGRLIGIKGVDHLLRVAIELKNRSLPFHFTIYGGGDLEDSMRRTVADNDLARCVTMAGAVDFRQQLIPEASANVDLYVMLHRQGDPSCTYLETLSCGIPIVGYANEAFAGILRLADVGLSVDIDDVRGVVALIERLNGDRAALVNMAKTAAAFAQEHDFEKTFRRRIEQLKRLVAIEVD